MQPMLDLQCFAEGESAAMAENGVPESATAENPVPEGTAGEQAAPAGEQTESFEELIKGKYKKDFDTQVQKILSSRFKNQKDHQAILDRMRPAMELMAQRYGLVPDEKKGLDYEALYQKLVDDNSMYEEEAFKRGMQVEDLKRMKQLEIENARLQRSASDAAKEAESRKAYDSLVRAGEELKAVYPDFDLHTEMQNPAFGRLVAVGVPLRTVYEVVHKDEILSGGMQYAVQKTQEKISKSIQSGLTRPKENGSSSQASAEIGSLDPSKLTRKDFAQIKARAERGERITFR